MAQVTEQQILEALKAVKDPDTGQDVVSAGMVSGLVIKDGNVAFALEVDPQRGPNLEPMRKQAEKTVHAMDGHGCGRPASAAVAASPGRAPPRRSAPR